MSMEIHLYVLRTTRDRDFICRSRARVQYLHGINFLKQNGSQITDTRGTRMILGRDIDWKPENVFSRVGGKYG
jgi:hypothetical protein